MRIEWKDSKLIPISNRPLLIARRDGSKKGHFHEDNDVVSGIYCDNLGFCNPKDGWKRYTDVVGWMYFPEHPRIYDIKKKNKSKIRAP
jgi:hypothetical protein